MVGGELRPLLPGQPLEDLGRVQVDAAVVAELLVGWPVLASSE